MNHLPLLEGGTQCSVQTILEVILTFPLDHVGEQVTKECRVLRQQGLEVKRPFDGDQLIKAELAWRELCPLAKRRVVGRIRTSVAHTLENHPG